MRERLLQFGLGTAVAGARAGRATLAVAAVPAGAVYRSRLGAPARGAAVALLELGAESEPLLRAWAGEQAEAAVRWIASGPLLAVAIEALAANPRVERTVTELLADPRLAQLGHAAVADPRVRRLIAEIVGDPAVVAGLRALAADPGMVELIRELSADPRIEALAREGLASPRLDRWLHELLVSDRLEELLIVVVDSGLVLDLTDRVLESEEMERVLRAVAASPEIRTALAEQSMGVAGEITTGVRERSVTLDDVVEQRVRRLLRRDRNGGGNR